MEDLTHASLPRANSAGVVCEWRKYLLCVADDMTDASPLPFVFLWPLLKKARKGPAIQTYAVAITDQVTDALGAAQGGVSDEDRGPRCGK